MLSYVRITEVEAFPEVLLTHFDDFLCDLHPPLPEILPTGLETFRCLGKIMEFSSHSLIVPIITSLSDGLCMWIADVHEQLLEQEYNDVVSISIYL